MKCDFIIVVLSFVGFVRLFIIMVVGCYCPFQALGFFVDFESDSESVRDGFIVCVSSVVMPRESATSSRYWLNELLPNERTYDDVDDDREEKKKSGLILVFFFFSSLVSNPNKQQYSYSFYLFCFVCLFFLFPFFFFRYAIFSNCTWLFFFFFLSLVSRSHCTLIVMLSNFSVSNSNYDRTAISIVTADLSILSLCLVCVWFLLNIIRSLIITMAF